MVFEQLTYLSVCLRDGSAIAVVDSPQDRQRLNDVLADRMLGPITLPLVRGDLIVLRCSEIVGWGPNTPEGRSAHRAFDKMCADEAEAEETPEFLQ